MNIVKEQNLPPPAIRVISEREAALRLSLAPRTLQEMRLRGTGPRYCQLTSKRIGYSEALLIEWINARETRSTAERVA